MKCLACGRRLSATDIHSPAKVNGGPAPMAAMKNSVVIIDRLRSVGRASQPPTLGDLRVTLRNIAELPDDAELSLKVSGALDSSVMVIWEAEAPGA
jgi:hypothetical protein